MPVIKSPREPGQKVTGLRWSPDHLPLREIPPYKPGEEPLPDAEFWGVDGWPLKPSV